MNRALTLIVFFVFTSITFFGAEVNRLNPKAAKEAWNQLGFLSDNLPQIDGAAIVVRPGVDTSDRTVWLISSRSGTYYIRGMRCSGEELTFLGAFGFGSNGGIFKILDTADLRSGAPGAEHPCSVEVFTNDNGPLQKLSALVYSWASSPVPWQVAEQPVTDGEYRMNLVGQISPGAVVILGGQVVGVTRSSPTGVTAVFPTNWMPPVGELVSITVCDGGECRTKAFERQVPTVNNGKG